MPKTNTTAFSKIDWVDMALKAAAEFKRGTVDITAADGTTVQAPELLVYQLHRAARKNPFTAARVVDEHLYKSSYINNTGVEGTKRTAVNTLASLRPTLLTRHWHGASTSAITIRSTSTRLRATSQPHAHMIYGDSLSDASLQDGKTVGEGHFRLVDSSNVLNVAASGHTFAIEYVDVDALGNETVTGLQGSVPIDIDPRALTPHFEGLEGLKAGEDVRAKIAASLEAKLETDACTAQLEFVHDANGAPGTAMAEGEAFAAGTYWVRAKGLLGDAAKNYTLATDGAASFTVTTSGNAGAYDTGDGNGNGTNAGGADKNDKGNKRKGSGEKLAGTGDNSGIAGLLAAAPWRRRSPAQQCLPQRPRK